MKTKFYTIYESDIRQWIFIFNSILSNFGCSKGKFFFLIKYGKVFFRSINNKIYLLSKVYNHKQINFDNKRFDLEIIGIFWKMKFFTKTFFSKLTNFGWTNF